MVESPFNGKPGVERTPFGPVGSPNTIMRWYNYPRTFSDSQKVLPAGNYREWINKY